MYRVPGTSSRGCNLCLPAKQSPSLDQEQHRGHPSSCHTRKKGRTKAEKSSSLFLSSDRPQPAFPHTNSPSLFIQRRKRAIVAILGVTAGRQAGRRHHPESWGWVPTFPG